LIFTLAGCSSSADIPDELTGESVNDVALVDKTIPVDDAYTYFKITADLRKCASPMCGGWFLSRLNQPTTQCHDGQWAASCYTPVLDWSKVNLSDVQHAQLLDACNKSALSTGVYAIVRGKFARTNSTPSPKLGRFVLSEAWVAEGDALSDGQFVRVKDNGLACFVAPCPSLTETMLNMTTVADIAEVDWTTSGLSDVQIEECSQDMFTPDGLVIAGSRYSFTENSNTADGRTVTAAYQRLVAP
jgi:hypothetical protein